MNDSMLNHIPIVVAVFLEKFEEADNNEEAEDFGIRAAFQISIFRSMEEAIDETESRSAWTV